MLEERVEGASTPQYQTTPSYQVPRRTEDPRNNYGMLKTFLREFHEQNDMPLPSGFHQRDKRQLTGMFNGMLGRYFTLEQILPRRYD